jgi:hypothetical protein
MVYISSLIKAIMYIFLNNARFASRLIAQENNFNFRFSSHCTYGMIHLQIKVKI